MTGLEEEYSGEHRLDRIDVALEPTRDAARSFAESVIMEEQKQRQAAGDGEEAKAQTYQA